jgi:hypothetical protein
VRVGLGSGDDAGLLARPVDRPAGVRRLIAVGVVALFTWGLAIGRTSGSSWAAWLFGAVISAGFGLEVVRLKALVH